jgi:hypothetical protein
MLLIAPTIVEDRYRAAAWEEEPALQKQRSNDLFDKIEHTRPG